MIKEMYKLFMGGMMILALSCKGTNSDVSESKDILLEVDNVGEGLLLSEEFTDVEIIPLENNPKAILSDVRKMIVTDRGMYFWDNGPKPQVLFFGHDGTFRNSIGSMGHAKGDDLYGYFHISSYNVCNGVVRGCGGKVRKAFETKLQEYFTCCLSFGHQLVCLFESSAGHPSLGSQIAYLLEVSFECGHASSSEVGHFLNRQILRIILFHEL